MVKRLGEMHDWIIGEVYKGTPPAKFIRGCKNSPKPHFHVSNNDTGEFTVCTEEEWYKEMVEKAIYEAEHDL